MRVIGCLDIIAFARDPMPTHAEIRHLPYSPRQLYDLVADVERYPEFLPWCVAARVKTRAPALLVADLVIGFKMIREKFTSRVVMQDGYRLDITYTEGPFKYLNNHWIFTPAPEGGTLIDFYIDFEFRSRLLQSLIGALFNEAVRAMISAFEKRAKALYSA